MENIGKIIYWQFELFGHVIKYNPVLLMMTWIVMAILVWFALKVSRNLHYHPGRLQVVAEYFYTAFKDLVDATLGEEYGDKYLPYIGTLFIFLLFCNYLGILPPIFQFFYLVGAFLDKFLPVPDLVYSWMLYVPPFQEPTKFLSTPLSLGLLSAVIVHISAIRIKGFSAYLKAYLDPMPTSGIWFYTAIFNPGYWFFFGINFVGEISKVISHSFRLFGNIIGGSIIILIISELTLYLGLPVFLLLCWR